MPQPDSGKANMDETELERLIRESEMMASENERLQLQLRETTEKYTAIRGSLSWRATAPLRVALDWAVAVGKALGLTKGRVLEDPLELSRENYRRWVAQFDHLDESDRRAIREGIAKLSQRPVFSLLLTVADPSADDLRETLKSIRQQLYKEWELLVVDDGSSAPHVARTLANFAEDPRVRITRLDRRGGLPAAGNAALAMATGEFVAFLEAGDVLSEGALFEISSEIAAHPDATIVYTDEDELDAKGDRRNPKFKTDWNPDLLLSQDYLGRLTAYSRESVVGAGGLLEKIDSACQYDLALRITAASDSRVRHIPAVLCHRRGPAPIDSDASRRAAQSFLGETARVEGSSFSMGHRVRWRPSSAKITVIIPTRDRAELLERCVEGLLNRTTHSQLEVIVVDNGSTDERTRQLFAKYNSLDNVRALEYPGEFNWSAMNNAGAKSATGEILLFLNNDTDVIEENWLTELASHAARPEIGAVGAKLLFADQTVQHGGIWLGPGVSVRHALRLSKRNDPGYLGQLALTRNLSAVTGACMAMRRAVFEEADGFDESFPVSYSDLDLCLRLIKKGYRIVWTPHAELLHLESATRGSGESRWRKEQADLERFRARWQEEMDNDPFFNPNLDLIGEEKLALAFPPRRKRAWRK
jgi:GT2 family glycosyltransferase